MQVQIFSNLRKNHRSVVIKNNFFYNTKKTSSSLLDEVFFVIASSPTPSVAAENLQQFELHLESGNQKIGVSLRIVCYKKYFLLKKEKIL